jgi:GMP synthase (glutamine-hydrolysing)
MTGLILVVEHEPDAGLSLMAPHLAEQVQVVRPHLGEQLPESAADGYAGLLVLGGAMGAWDDEAAPWLPATRTLLADAVRAELPTLGICLGAQLLAAACGGTAERGAAGLELGVVPVTPLPVADADPFFAGVQRVLKDDPAGAAGSWLVRQYHFDAVTALPPDTELVVTGTAYPHQGFRVGPAAWGVQYHPEVSTDLFAAWVAGGLRLGELSAAATDVLGPIRDAAATQSLVAAAHARAFLDVVRSPVLHDHNG